MPPQQGDATKLSMMRGLIGVSEEEAGGGFSVSACVPTTRGGERGRLESGVSMTPIAKEKIA